jgi:hypothetical protein
MLSGMETGISFPALTTESVWTGTHTPQGEYPVDGGGEQDVIKPVLGGYGLREG